ncbi:hypothetical protein Dimus_017026 [Dionaea muscipula]
MILSYYNIVVLLFNRRGSTSCDVEVSSPKLFWSDEYYQRKVEDTKIANKRLVHEEVLKAVERDRSLVQVRELSKNGLMEIIRKRVRPSVTYMISEPCSCCHATGRVEALETSFSKIEHEICRLLAETDQRVDPERPKSLPKLLLRADGYMCEYLTSGKKTRLATLCSSLKVWIILKVARSFTRGAFEVELWKDDKAKSDKNFYEPRERPAGAVTHISTAKISKL